MKNKIKFIAIGLCCCLLLGIFILFPLNTNKKIYAIVDLKSSELGATKVEWNDITEEDYIRAISQKYHIPFSKAKQMNFENNMKQIPEAFDKNADDSYAPQIVYRVITVTQDTSLNAQVIGTVHAKMVVKGTYSHASAYKKFVEVINSYTGVKGNFSPLWEEKWLDTRIEDGNEQENSLWISVAGILKYDIDAKVAAELNLGNTFNIEASGSTRVQFSDPISFIRELHSNDY